MLVLKGKTVPLREIDGEDRSFSWRYGEPGEDELEALCASMRENGLIHPLVIRRKSECVAYQIVCGHRRFAALERLSSAGRNWEVVPCRVVEEASDEELWQLSYDENRQRRKVSPLEIAYTIDRFARQSGLRYEEIGAGLRIHPKTVQRYRSLLAAQKFVKDAVHRGEITYLQGVHLSKLPAEEQRLLLPRIQQEGMSVRALLREIRKRKSRCNLSADPLHDLVVALPEGAKIRLTPTGRCVLQMEFARPKHAEDLLSVLRRRVEQLEMSFLAMTADVRRQSTRIAGCSAGG